MAVQSHNTSLSPWPAPTPPPQQSDRSPQPPRARRPANDSAVVLPSPSISDAAAAADSSSINSTSTATHRRAVPSVGGPLPKAQRSTSVISSLASAALDRTQSAIASFSEPVFRSLQSYSSASGLARQSQNSTLATSSPAEPVVLAKTTSNPASLSHVSTNSSSSSLPTSSSSNSSHSQVSGRPTTASARSSSAAKQSSTQKTLPDLPPQHNAGAISDEMHQTSSRLLRMTDDDRPFTRDFNDLFSTLIVSLLPLSPHRVRLTKVDYTFLSEDAINNLGSLKFSQSNRMPDPKDPSRIVTTTTTTTFSMARDMARSICQRFVDARFIESADGKYQQTYTMKGSVWQLTSKGVSVVVRFCAKNGIQQKQVTELANTNCAQLVILERDQQTDKLIQDWGTIEVIFRRFVGAEGRNTKPTAAAADSDSLLDYKDGLTGVKMAAERKVNGRIYRDTFTGKAASDWLMDCSTIVDRREANEIATLFVEHEFMESLAPDRTYIQQYSGSGQFQPTKYAIYQISQKGKTIINGNKPASRASDSDGTSPLRNGFNRDSNNQRLERILGDPALRLLFRENLRDTHCEENLSFYKDVNEFVQACKAAIAHAEKSPTAGSMDVIKEIMAQAYGIYNAFLAPGSPCELNIDHNLRNNLATRMTKAVGQEGSMINTLREVTALFEDAQNAVFKLMASDSVPKFLRNTKYEQQLRNFDTDSGSTRALQRSQSQATKN